MKPFTHALALGLYLWVPTEGSSKRLFCLSDCFVGAKRDLVARLHVRVHRISSGYLLE